MLFFVVQIGLGAFAAIHEQPFPLPHYCGICDVFKCCCTGSESRIDICFEENHIAFYTQNFKFAEVCRNNVKVVSSRIFIDVAQARK